MERNWQEKIFRDEYMRQKARDQYGKDNTKPTSSRFETIRTVITYGAVIVIAGSLVMNFSEALGFQLFIVSLQAQLSGLMNAVGWLVVLLWLVLSLGLGYFRFIKTDSS